METNRTPAGWYQDPTDAAGHRYWDGTRWATFSRPSTPLPAQIPFPVDTTLGSPANPLGAGSVGLAAALTSLMAKDFTAPAKKAEIAPVLTTPRRRRWKLGNRAA